MKVDEAPPFVLHKLIAVDSLSAELDARLVELSAQIRAGDNALSQAEGAARELADRGRGIGALRVEAEQLGTKLRAVATLRQALHKWLGGLPAGTVLERVEVVVKAGRTLPAVRQEMASMDAEWMLLERAPRPAVDLDERVARYVQQLAARGLPIVSGIGPEQQLDVKWPTRPDASRNNQGGYGPVPNPLLLAALLQPEALGKVIRDEIQRSVDAVCPPAEREFRITAAKARLHELGFEEERLVEITGAERRADVRPEHVLMARVVQAKVLPVKAGKAA